MTKEQYGGQKFILTVLLSSVCMFTFIHGCGWCIYLPNECVL